ncbi:aminotransferase [Zavarzinia sp. CC-PAN008]|uniref:aminotransferase n=1 Tax=Zavarzinia sp. CC-PAN008 TaxID=3243332 RepID=UPI003F748F1A
MKPANPIIANLGTTIFTVMSALAVEHGAINLGQGFPDEDGPDDVRAEAARRTLEGPNQYPPMRGLVELRRAVAERCRLSHGLDYQGDGEVLVTSGATEAIAAAILALVQPGDEVVLFEPLYDCYLPMVRLAGGVPRLVRLAPPDWTATEAALAAAFSPRTKLVLLNTPMNPNGKVWRQDELERLAAHVVAADAYVLSDEVYEHLVLDGRVHRSPAHVPALFERTLRVGSAGKTFALTGWKVGYLSGPAALIDQVAKAHQFLTFTTPPNLQYAVALGLAKGEDYYAGLSSALAAKRDRLTRGLEAAGLAVLPVEGTYFLSVDLRSIGWTQDDVAFCRHITTEAKVAAVPVSAFYAGDDPPRHLARFCFCKKDAVLDEASRRLAAHFKRAAA